MPAPRNAPTRASQRRNSHQDDTPTRTRGRGGRPGLSKPASPQLVPPKASPTKSSPSITRKATRSALNVSGNAFEAAAEIYASYEEPLFMVFGVPAEFFNSLKKHHGKLPKERKNLIGSLPQRSPSPEEDSQSEAVSAEESESDAAVDVKPSSRGGLGGGRGRGGGRGGRGGRGRGGRPRGRGGRPRGGAARTTSPVRTRPSRNAAPIFPLTEDDDEQLSSHSSPDKHAKLPLRPHSAGSVHSEGELDEEDEEMVGDDESEQNSESMEDVRYRAGTPGGSPPEGLLESILEGTYTPASAPKTAPKTSSTNVLQLPIPRISLSNRSASHTPREMASTPAESAVPKLLDPDDDILSDSDLPDPWIEDAPSPIEAECDDRADYLLQKRFKPMADVQAAIAALTKFPASQRSTENLYALAENTQKILKAWQDEYLMLDARTAPHMHPAKKACNGGRIPLAPEIFEDLKEADLYGYTYDPKKLPGCQDPWAQRPGAGKSGGRELRTRRARDLLDSAAPSEEDEDEDNEGRPSKRQRRATRKFDGTDTGTGTNTPKKHNGWGGARKKGVSRFAKPSSETPEPESRPAKRARAAARNLLHQRIQEMREESIIGSSGDEGSSAMDADEYSDTNPKRGRPAGSKNSARRSDYGIKKGPRKKPTDANTPASSASGPSAPPATLTSMTEGQGQFTIDEPLSSTPLQAQGSAETVFQATPQPHVNQETPLVHPSKSKTPDAYMITTPLSQYTNNYVEDSSPLSGSRRKPRVKSEKRSQSMTIWWAERKARKREQDEKNGTPVLPLVSRSSSASRKGARTSGSPATGSTGATSQLATSDAMQAAQYQHSQQHPQPPPPQHSQSLQHHQHQHQHQHQQHYQSQQHQHQQTQQHQQHQHNSQSLQHQQPPQHQQHQQPQPMHQPQQPQQLSPIHHHHHQQQQTAAETYGSHYSQTSPTGPPPHYVYSSAPPPQHSMVLQYSPLTAVPSGPFPPYSAPPPPNSQSGPRALAPAPTPLQPAPTYPSPYGPQSPAGSRPKSSGQPPRSGPPPLAPAPSPHFSPYGPISMDRQMPFKVMIPGPTQTEPRRESR